MNLQQLQAFPKDRVRALLGLEPAALSQLLAAVLPELVARRRAQQTAKPGRKRGPGGGRRRKLFPYQEVLLTLVYLRHNVSHAVVGQMFGVSADISAQTLVRTASTKSFNSCATSAQHTVSMPKRSEPKKNRLGIPIRSTWS